MAAAGQLDRLPEAVEGQGPVSPGAGVNWLANAAIARSFVSQTGVMSTTKLGRMSLASVMVAA